MDNTITNSKSKLHWGITNIGLRALWDLGGGDRGDFLARKIYAIPECVITEIGIQTHSNCTINKIVHNFHIS